MIKNDLINISFKWDGSTQFNKGECQRIDIYSKNLSKLCLFLPYISNDKRTDLDEIRKDLPIVTSIKRCEGIVDIKKESFITVTINQFNSFSFKVVILRKSRVLEREIKVQKLDSRLSTDVELIFSADNELHINTYLRRVENNFTRLSDHLYDYIFYRIYKGQNNQELAYLFKDLEFRNKQLLHVILKVLSDMETKMIDRIEDIKCEVDFYNAYQVYIQAIMVLFFNRMSLLETKD